jgi:hypothetical protein
LLESLQSPISDIEAWAEEIEQRIVEFDRGEISAYPAEDVFADARRMLFETFLSRLFIDPNRMASSSSP